MASNRTPADEGIAASRSDARRAQERETLAGARTFAELIRQDTSEMVWALDDGHDLDDEALAKLERKARTLLSAIQDLRS